MNPRLISIIVPCYNQAQYLSEALESVLLQTYTNWECIVINDGSTDNTEEIAKEWLRKDSRYKYIKIENGGLSNARNIGISNAVGSLILPLDSDDKISDRYLKLAVNEFEKNKNIKVVYCKAKRFGLKTGEWRFAPFTLKNLATKNMIFCSAFFYKKDWLEIGGYDIKMKWGFEDWEFWISLLKNGGDVSKINEFCFNYRVKQKSMLKDLDSEKQKYLKDYLSKKHTSFFIEMLGSFIELEERNRLNDKKIKHLEVSKKHALNVLLKSFIKNKN